MRLPLEWQRLKEQAWAHPFLAAACVTTAWTLFQNVSYCCGILSGDIALSWAFRWSARLLGILGAPSLDVQAVPTLPPLTSGATSVDFGDTPTVSEVKLVSSWWLPIAMGVAGPAPPAAVAASIFFLQVAGELGKARLRWASTFQAGAVAWSAAILVLLSRVCLGWDESTCRQLEAKQDLVCQEDFRGFFSSLVCKVETTAECELFLFILFAYAWNALISLLGSLLGAWGILQARHLLERPSLQAHWFSSAGESQVLLAEPKKVTTHQSM